MSVKKAGKKWRADWRDARGVRRRKDFKLKADAEHFESDRRREADRLRGALKGSVVEDARTTFAQWTERQIEEAKLRDLAPASVARMKSVANVHLVPALGTVPVVNISRARIKTLFVTLLRDGKMRRTSVSQIARTFSGIMAPAVSAFGLPSNPVIEAWRELNPRGRKGARVKKAPTALDRDQTRRLLAAAQEIVPEWHPLLAALFMAGLRPSEGMAITPDHVDFANSSITIDRQLSQHGLATTKTGEQRIVEMSPALAEILRAAIKRPAPSGKVIPFAQADQIAATEGTSTPAPWPLAPILPAEPTPKQIRLGYRHGVRAFHRALKRAKIERPQVTTENGREGHFGLHVGRHSFASQLVAAGVSIAFVARQLGHADPTLTAVVYGSHLPAVAPGAVAALGADLAGGRQMDTKAEIGARKKRARSR
jgi:integrase